MELKDFINKTVIATYDNKKMFLTEITSPYIGTQTVERDRNGYYTCYSYETINGDPFERGILVFEDPKLLPLFREAYDKYCRTEDAYWESYGYWLHKEY